MIQSCQNCARSLDPGFVYCPTCGQKTETRRLHLYELLSDAWMQFTDIDRGFFKLLRDLVASPGRVAREYISGKRKRHFGPLNFYLIVGTVLILMMNVTGWIHAVTHSEQSAHVISNASQENNNSSKAPDPTSNTRSADKLSSDSSAQTGQATSTKMKFKMRQQAVDSFWAQYSDLVSIAAAPLLSFFFWLFYRRAGFNYTELLVASLYMIGFTNLVYALVVSPLSAVVSPGTRPTQAIVGGFKVFEIIYFTWFYYQLAYDKVKRPLLRAGLASILVAIFWSALTISLVAVYMMTGFGLE